jgi:hypothetical protein
MSRYAAETLAFELEIERSALCPLKLYSHHGLVEADISRSGDFVYRPNCLHMYRIDPSCQAVAREAYKLLSTVNVYRTGEVYL